MSEPIAYHLNDEFLAVEVEAKVEKGVEGFLDLEVVANLLGLTRRAYCQRMAQCPHLADGMNKCWLVAGIAHGVAQAIGLQSHIFGGQVFDEVGTAKYPGNGHYWTVVNDTVVVESLNAALIACRVLWSPDARRVPLKYPGNKKMASMKKAQEFDRIALAARIWVERGAQGPLEYD